ncbi:MAG: InlB B-repeat-containing protein, partial [Clostridiales bacterium]
PAVSTVNYNSDVKLSQALSLEGYTFDGWTTADATIDNDSFKMPAKDVTLIGNFTKKDVVTVTFKLDGGTYQGETKDVVYKVYKNEGLKANQTVPVPTKTGYTFKNFPGFKANDTYAKDTVYTADWTINNYQVTYTVEQGIPYKGDLPAVSTVNYNSDVKLSQALSLEGYTF